MKFEFHPTQSASFMNRLFAMSSMCLVGRRFAHEVARAVDVLLERPEIGSRLDDDLRHFVLRKFPYSIIYAVSGDVISIVALAHGSREPGYWRPRIHDR